MGIEILYAPVSQLRAGFRIPTPRGRRACKFNANDKESKCPTEPMQQNQCPAGRMILGGLFTPDFFVQLAGAWACPIAFVIAGVYIAPKFKFVVALSYSLNGSNDVRNDILGAVHRVYSRRR